ncbi:MAG: DUF1634 domain-containing protein [Bradymonadales bacterium]|nr:DUF1634 domain-containing protein [Bradymonadales bacterium]
MDADSRNQEKIRLARRTVQLVLRLGLALAVVLMMAGLAIRLASGDLTAQGVPLFRLFGNQRPGEDLMALGLLVLAAVPPLRVVSLLILWCRERDTRFVLVAITVVAVLLLAVAAGGG